MPEFNCLNSREGITQKGSNALMLTQFLSSLAHVCVNELLGFESDYDGVSQRQGHLWTNMRLFGHSDIIQTGLNYIQPSDMVTERTNTQQDA
jgi:hypothetical protein